VDRPALARRLVALAGSVTGGSDSGGRNQALAGILGELAARLR
jgi:hypothetical protein